MGSDAKQGIAFFRRLVAIKDDWNSPPSRRFANRTREVGIPVVGKNQVGRRDNCFRIVWNNGRDALVAIRHYGSVAAGVDEYRRQRRRQSANPMTRSSIDIFAIERR